MPKVSIIIPIYNVEPYIEECLRSVFAQTFTDYECILVDDCGTDRSVEIAEQLISDYNGPATYRILHHDKNRGLSAARNTGIRATKGEYVYFLDSDDKLFPYSIESLVEMVNNHLGVDVIQGNLETQDGQFIVWQLDKKKYPKYTNDIEWIRREILWWRFGMFSWNKLIKRTFLQDNSITFNEDIIHEDILFSWDIQKHIKSIAFVFEPTYWYRTLNGNSIMHNTDKSRTYISYMTIANVIASDIKNHDELMFIMKLLTLHNKYSWWPDVQNKKKVLAKFLEVKRGIKKRGFKYAEIMNALNLLLLPWWMMNNPIAKKLYFEYEKRHNIQCGTKSKNL